MATVLLSADPRFKQNNLPIEYIAELILATSRLYNASAQAFWPRPLIKRAMARLFISYSSSDRSHIASLAQALGRAGFEVWWDRELIGGQDFAQVIEQQIADADLVIVVWSRDAITSQWVRAEAQKAENKLLPIRIEPVSPPAPFNALHTLDVHCKKPAQLVEHVKARLDGTSPSPPAQIHEHSRRGWAIAALVALLVVVGGGFSLYTGILDLSFGLLPSPTTDPKSKTSPGNFDARVASFEATPEDDLDTVALKTKVERNFVEFLSRNGLKVGHVIAAAGAGKNAGRVINGTIIKTPSGWTVSADITSGGILIAGASLDAPASLIKQAYRSIPEALLFGMKVDPKLNRAHPAKPVTQSTEAYLAFLGAQDNVRRGREEEGLALLDQAIALDPNFAAAIWSKGDLLARRGEPEKGESLKHQAQQIDPDHARVSLLPNSANPMPAIFAAAAQAEWTVLEPGIAQRVIETKAYGIRIAAWAIDPSMLLVEAVQAGDSQGGTATELRSKTEALLVVNGGYFDMDAEGRLTPSGLLIVGGKVLQDVQPHAGSGVLVTGPGHVMIERSKDFVVPPDAVSGFQSGPLLVDPGGAFGIYSNDLNRVPRTSVCLVGGKVVIVVVEGGLSLYELAELLVAPTERGGFGCERALNLDGGPSTQASLAVGSETLELQGLWNVLSAVQVRRR